MINKSLISTSIVFGLISGYLLFGNKTRNIEKRIEYPMLPDSVEMVDRNGDGILDIVQKFPYRCEVVLFGRKDEKGNLEYSLEKK